MANSCESSVLPSFSSISSFLTTILIRTGSESILTLFSSDSPSSEVRQELVEISEYSDGTALIGRGGFLGEVWAEKELKIRIGPQNQFHFCMFGPKKDNLFW